MSSINPTVSQTVRIAAPPEHVYSLVTDLTTLAELAEETTSMTWKQGTSAVPGAVFSGDNANGARSWTTRCTVTDAVPGRVFGFEVDMPLPFTALARWQYDIVGDDDGGCTVTESTWDRRNRLVAVLGARTTGVKDRTAASRAHIAATLERLKARAEQR